MDLWESRASLVYTVRPVSDNNKIPKPLYFWLQHGKNVML